MRRILFLTALLASASTAQPVAVGSVEVESIATLPGGVVSVAADPTEGVLYALTQFGFLFRVSPVPGSEPVLVASPEQHGGPGYCLGLDIDAEGTIYLIGARTTMTTNTGVVRRGRLSPAGTAAGREWTTLVETAPYPLGRTAFDHSFSAVAVHPSGQWVALNSGSRTDHGEVQSGEGVYPGVREVPLTSGVFRVPTDVTDLILPADEASLVAGGYLFADGTRNSFGLAFAPDGELFGAENSGDRDDGDELNWLRQGRHYGFPWRMGTYDTPQQFADYDPDADPLVNQTSPAYLSGAFANDPTYPPPPDGVTFTDPIRNLGPDADEFRLPDGTIVDASAAGIASTTFTPHRSPLGLVFRREEGPALCDAFMLSWTDGEDGSGSLLSLYEDTGEDLVCLNLNGSRTEVTTTRLVSGFRNPISIALIGSTLYIAEFGEPYGLWSVSAGSVASAPNPDGASVTASVAPNPLQRNGTVSVSLPEARTARIRLVDTRGRTVATLHDGLLGAGVTRLPLRADQLAAGVYAVVVEAGEAPVVRTLTVAR